MCSFEVVRVLHADFSDLEGSTYRDTFRFITFQPRSVPRGAVAAAPPLQHPAAGPRGAIGAAQWSATLNTFRFPYFEFRFPGFDFLNPICNPRIPHPESRLPDSNSRFPMPEFRLSNFGSTESGWLRSQDQTRSGSAPRPRCSSWSASSCSRTVATMWPDWSARCT